MPTASVQGGWWRSTVTATAGLVWAVLGVLKAGAAFLILDPAYPGSRLADCLRRAKPQGWLQMSAAGVPPRPVEECLAQLPYHFRLELPHRAAVANTSPLANCSTEDPGVVIGPDDMAYLAFTSGSTGNPKGVIGTHSPLSHFIDWQVLTFGFLETDHFSLFTGLAHDPLLREIFTPLWLGATLHIPEQEDLEDPSVLADWIREQEISIVHLSPALGTFLGEAPPGNLPRRSVTFFLPAMS